MRLLRTIGPLRPSQLFWRLRFVAERTLGSMRRPGSWSWAREEVPPLRPGFPELPALHPPGPPGLRLVELLDEGVVEHLHQARHLGRERPDWRLGPRSEERLWTITLHYHAWAYGLAEAAATGDAGISARAAELFRHYVADWIERAALERPGSTDLAWNAYATATRIGWWVRAHRLARTEIFAPDPTFETRFLRSLWRQAAYLADHLEWDLRANHLMRDLAGLAVAGRFFAGEAADVWLARSTRLAVVQVGEQVLPDGGHFERSPSYHFAVMGDVETLHSAVGEEGARRVLREAWGAMAEVLAWMRHPDGDLALLNDSTLAGPIELARTLSEGPAAPGRPIDASPRSGSRHFPFTGLAVLHAEPWSVFFDAGEVGPDVQPGHAHADTLTLECSYGGRRLVVDPGSFAYDDDPRRRYDRSTEAHNTVAIDGDDSSEVWGIFRVGRRARPLDVEVAHEAGTWRAAAGHDGYDWLPGRPRHRREVRAEERQLHLRDWITGAGEHNCRGGLLIDSAWSVQPTEDGWWLSHPEAGRLRVTVSSPGALERFIERRPYHPSHGVEVEATRIGWRWQGEPPLEVRTSLTEER